jgi:ferrochelatase
MDTLNRLAERGVQQVVVAPIGFISDHMEVAYDLDVQAAGRARELGLRLVRAATVGTDPRFVAMIGELYRERTVPGTPRRSLGTLGPAHDRCPVRCCLATDATALPVIGGAQ